MRVLSKYWTSWTYPLSLDRFECSEEIERVTSRTYELINAVNRSKSKELIFLLFTFDGFRPCCLPAFETIRQGFPANTRPYLSLGQHSTLTPTI